MVLRTDEIRKRQWGRTPTERLPPEAYAPAAGDAVYGELFATARSCLAAGQPVIADAVFLRPDERAAIEAVARDAGALFHGLWLDAPPATLRARVAGRRGDASDADERVLNRQLTMDAGHVTWRRRSDAGAPGAPGAIQRTLGLPIRGDAT